MEYLVAVDGSREGDNALAYAIDVAEATGASITAIHAVDPTVFAVGGDDPIESFADADRRLVMQSVEDAEERGTEILEEAVGVASDQGADIQTELVYGPPVKAITEYAEEAGVDAIFVGHRGRSEHSEAMVGSVAKAIVTRARVPVTVVR